MSEGTNTIRFIDPVTLQTVRAVTVCNDQAVPVTNINELEYINGEIYANIWLMNGVRPRARSD
jgi:glutaminyl-peptide cyclotransferase